MGSKCVTTIAFRSESYARGARMLRTALGPAIAGFLDDPEVVEVMLNPDGRLWLDRLSNGLEDTGCRLGAADAERIVRRFRVLRRERQHRDLGVMLATCLPSSLVLKTDVERVAPAASPLQCFARERGAKHEFKISVVGAVHSLVLLEDMEGYAGAGSSPGFEADQSLQQEWVNGEESPTPVRGVLALDHRHMLSMVDCQTFR